MPIGLARKRYLIIARDYILEYLEAYALVENLTTKVAKFLENNVFIR